MNIGESSIDDPNATIIGVKSRVREILQIDQLISIREYLILKATIAIK